MTPRFTTARAMVRVFSLLLAALLLSQPAFADDIEILVNGVSDAAAENVRAQLGGGWVSGGVISSKRRQRGFVERAEQEAAIALRPFGYYHATASAELVNAGDGAWRLTIDIKAGEPVLVEDVRIVLQGPGENFPELVEWQEQWPLQPGDRLEQTIWSDEKQALADTLDEMGFFLPTYLEQQIALDLDRSRATLVLIVDTGPRATLGTIAYKQGFLDERVLTPVARFDEGDAYRAWFVEQLRMDLWKLGMFEDISVREQRDLEAEPPVVNLEVTLLPSHRNTHQGTIGYGTDTEFRMQYRWLRHYLSERGDSFSAGFGYKTRDDELLLFGEYRLPRKVESHEYWLLNILATRENQVFELDIEGREETLPIADGRINDILTRFGRVRLRSPTFSREQIIETIFIQHIDESNEFNPLEDIFEGRPELQSDLEDLIPKTSVQSLAVGMDWDWPEINGRGFDLTGHRERASIFVSNQAWGSDVDYAQAYLSTRWNLRLGDDWRLLLRGEVGFSDAETQDLTFTENDVEFGVSITELPFLYRFKAGGTHSVRGYAFESLSNNGIGSNHLVTASVEIERRVWGDWSVAAFADAGNAFNHWDNLSLRKGVGVGVRWYAIGFPLRLDIAQAQDLDGKPWRVHFTIGSPLF